MRPLPVAGVFSATLTLALGATLAVRAEHTEMVRPSAIPALPPIPALERPIGTAYQQGRSKGAIRLNDACVHTVAFRHLDGIGVTDGEPGTGDEIICHTHMWMDLGVPAFGTLVRRAEVMRSGRVRDSARLDQRTPFCRPGSGDSWYELRGTRCYEADPSHRPVITIPFADDPTQGFVLGTYAPRPASRLIAVEGNARQADLRQ